MVKKLAISPLIFIFLAVLQSSSFAAEAPDQAALGLRLWCVLPFVGILLSIALFPLLAPGFWDRSYPYICAAWGVPTALWVLTLDPSWLLHTAIDYVGFIALLASLFVICGGIYVKGRIRGTPAVNTLILAIGCVLANFIGTTGASMVLVRPLLRANANRKHRAHQVIFFIFLASNIGGCLTPLGDPPLFLGLLKGVPFFWTTTRLLPEWLFACGVLLALFYAIDSWYYHRREETAAPFVPKPMVIDGKMNFFFLGGVVGAVLLYSALPRELGYWREAIQVALMAGFATISYRYTPNNVHIENEFAWHPIREVAVLFAAIFACMIPALKLLHARGDALGVTQPWQFFWAAGGLSSFLDNAPTYLTFVSLGTAVSRHAPEVVRLIDGAIAMPILKAISLGAVFMGANSYIGNGPNFMVKSIADHSGVRMPGFFGYMAWSVTILIPLFLLVTWVFLR